MMLKVNVIFKKKSVIYFEEKFTCSQEMTQMKLKLSDFIKWCIFTAFLSQNVPKSVFQNQNVILKET